MVNLIFSEMLASRATATRIYRYSYTHDYKVKDLDLRTFMYAHYTEMVLLRSPTQQNAPQILSHPQLVICGIYTLNITMSMIQVSQYSPYIVF